MDLHFIPHGGDPAQDAHHQACHRNGLVCGEAEAEELKLSKLEQRLKDYPNAAKWIWEGEKLEVSRALAGNTRAVLQVGQANEILSAFTVREMLDEDDDDDD